MTPLRPADNADGEKSSWTAVIHTPDSSTGEEGPTVRKALAPEHTAKVVASLLKIVFWGAEQLMLRTGRKLRRPTEDQMLDMAEPTSTLIVRHTPLAYAPESLVDISQLAGAVADYLQDGPLVTPAYPVRHLGTESQEHPGDIPPSSYVPASASTSEPTVSYLQ